MNFEAKRATVRYAPAKVRLSQILKRYDSTPFTVAPAGPITSVLHQEHATVKAWREPRPAEPSTEAGERVPVLIEFIPETGYRIGSAKVTVSESSAPGLKLVDELRESDPAGKAAAQQDTRRFTFQVAVEGSSAGSDVSVLVDLQFTRIDQTGNEQPAKETISVLLVSRDRNDETPLPQAGVMLVGGALELGLAHLCDQKGCVAHLHKSLQALPGVAGVRPRPSLDDPRATLFVQAGKAVDLWNLRHALRDRSIEARRLTAADVDSFAVQIELRRWQTQDAPREPSQCLACLARTLEAVRSLRWATQAASTEAGLRIRPIQRDADLMSLITALERVGVAPAAVWLVPDGVSPVPAAPTTTPTAHGAEPKRGGSEAHPLVQFDFDHNCTTGPNLLDVLNEQPWVSRTGHAPADLGAISPSRVVSGASHLAAIGDRQTADLLALVRQLRGNGQVPKQIRLSGFGEVRIQCEFAHLCGEVEYSKPPKKEPKKPEDDKKTKDDKKPEASTKSEGENKTENQPDASKKDKDDKPFVPQPLRPAPSSNSRQAIERALTGIDWIKEAKYHEYHTRPEFNGPRKLFLALTASGEHVIQLGDLIQALTEAGFPPTALRVSRLFPGVAFGDPLPGDLELAAANGEKRLLSSFRQLGRPLAVAFVSLNCPKWDKYKYGPEPKFYRQLKETVGPFRDRVDFVAVSANPDDDLAKVGELLAAAELHIPLLRDPSGQVRAVLNAQITPAPHLYVFDSDGLLRYAGDAHDNWEKPTETQKDFLGPALELILSGKFAANSAVFFKSPKCNCSSPNCKCPKCGCGPTCRCDIKH